MEEKAQAERGQYLGLYIGAEEYAIGILQVKEILQFESITRVPGMPPSMRGVINVRGSVVPVVDLALKFGLPETEVSNRTCVVILEARLDGEATVMGVMADAVSQVVELSAADILPPPAFGTRVHADYITGMGRSGRKFILVLDIDRLLADDELKQAGTQAGAAEGATPESAAADAAAAEQGEAIA